MEYLLKGICGSMNWVRYRSGSVRLNFRKPLDALPSHARAETNLNRHRRAKEPAQSSREEILAVRQRSCVEKIGVHPIATSRSHERAAQSDPLRYRARNGRHQRCAPQPSERRGDRLPAPMDRMSFHTCPNHQQARLFLAHPCLPLGIILNIGAVVVEEIALNVRLSWLDEKIIFIGPEIRVVALDVGIVADVARARGRKREKICAQRAFVC